MNYNNNQTHHNKQYTVIIAKVREPCRKYLNHNRLIWPIIKLYCFHHYHIVICYNTIYERN